ncbi:gas vesicle protein GvpG [Actinoplanes sp. NPDC049548]|uniref:gas vesicle protein GvpG n=1 Tax=Actinoplanes sp. NPDC049548 TaxID=3155152 RepID=UPI00342BD17D
MGLLTLPLAPLHGLVWLARILADQAAAECDPAVAIRGRLAEAEQALAAGLITEDECAAVQDELLERLLQLTKAPVAGAPGE